MYHLQYPSRALSQPLQLCTSGDQSFGCTFFDFEHYGSNAYPYPYKENPVTVPFETDYLLDVVPQELGPYYDPTALRAQAIAARTYAYWHLEHGYTMNNSNSYHVFLPLKFESLSPATAKITATQPCALENLGEQRERICDAVAPLHYLTYRDESNTEMAIFSEFTSDVFGTTMDNAADRAGDPAPYLTGMPDPISVACDANDFGHGHGMSQEGASRWGRGHQCSHATASTLPGNNAGVPWPVQWTHAEQILTHYYTGVSLKDASGQDLLPPYRWLSLWLDIPQDIEMEQTHQFTLVVQNNGLEGWSANHVGEQNIALSFQLLRPSGTCAHNCEALVYEQLPHDVAPGEVVTLTPTIYLPNIYPCDMTLRLDMALLQPNEQPERNATAAVDFWFAEQFPAWIPLDIPLAECPARVYLPGVRQFLQTPQPER